ncbi:unnamed protein product [Brugia timori]|uniref:Uncharacterized protein n=1 Tax=Brugia timori TaxID=42155 RepID=A0A0R3R746_9BILA|nr:unnamed protein product [Brugia timori]
MQLLIKLSHLDCLVLGCKLVIALLCLKIAKTDRIIHITLLFYSDEIFIIKLFQ